MTAFLTDYGGISISAIWFQILFTLPCPQFLCVSKVLHYFLENIEIAIALGSTNQAQWSPNAPFHISSFNFPAGRLLSSFLTKHHQRSRREADVRFRQKR